MNFWRQKRLFTCTGCGQRLLHDQMHKHWAFRCPDRRMLKKKRVLVGRIFRPAIGGDGR
jgi:DNA-directed RNA polymerase subunit RPC12/RpoP